MRTFRFPLILTASLLAILALSAAIESGISTVNTAQSNKHESGFLRVGAAAEVRTSANNEERAIIKLGKHIVSNKADTKKLLQTLLKEEKPMSVYKFKEEFLNIPSTITSFDKLVEHANWKTLVKYQRLKWEKEHGRKMPYAVIDEKLLTKQETQEQLLKWLVQRKRLETVGDNLGVWSVPNSYPITHQNWRAFEMYEKWSAGIQRITINPDKYAMFGTGYQTKEKTEAVLTEWAMQGTPISTAMQSLKLNGLSASEMVTHKNFPALLTYVKYYMQLEPIRVMRAGGHPRAKRPAA